MKTRLTAKDLAYIGVVAALYAAMTLAVAPLSFEAVQLRFSEILVLLCFYRKEYCYSMVLGCAVANMFSPLGVTDVIFGTLATLIAVIGIRLIVGKQTERTLSRLFAASLMPVLSNGIIIGLEIYILFGEMPLLPSILSVAAGELIVVSVIGVAVFRIIEKNKVITNLILGV